MTLLDDQSFGGNASTLADRTDWPSAVLSAVSPGRGRQQAPLIVEVDLSAQRRVRAIHLSREVPPPDLEKLKHLSREINRLMALSKNWDGRGGEPLDLEIVRTAFPVIGTLVLLTDTTVELFGQADGGLQAEWHLGHADIEIEFDADGDVVTLIRAESGDRQAGYFEATRERIKDLLRSTVGPTALRPP